MLDLLEKSYYEQETAEIGLTQLQAEKILKENGDNLLKMAKKKSPMKIFANQFHDIMTMILLIGAGISALLGEVYDALTIIIIVLINSILGFIQEFKTEKTLESLEKMTAPTARVYRNGKLIEIPASKMVVGDVFELEAGDRAPCDAVILSSRNLMCDESILTGEAVPCEKECNESAMSFDALNLSHMVYMGCTVTKGTARCKAVLTGQSTQMGRVSQMLSSISDELTPLQKKLGELGRVLCMLCIGVCFVVFLAGVIRGEPFFEMLMTGITIAIAAIPEGLPATVTIALALAVRRMLKKNALVHKLHSVETLGCASVICTDKTGTVTENKMTVTNIYCVENDFEVLGTGYKKSGEIRYKGDRIEAQNYPALEETLTAAALCCNAKITPPRMSGRDRASVLKTDYAVIGDPTEIALLIAAEKANISTSSYTRIDEIPFESETRKMQVTVENESGRFIYTKGAPDVILAGCTSYQKGLDYYPMSPRERAIILRKNEELASKALRVLAVQKTCGNEVIFLGLIGMIDPPRQEAKAAIRTCSNAKIKTVMITGDHKLTACAVAKQAGIMKEGMRSLTGAELSKLSDEELDSIIDEVAVFARVNPSDKLRIVRAYRKKGHICAMTGDGVNDAPAIKEADIGVSMGITGTDVTKQAADVILLDDNFASLVDAVEQGRTIYANIRKFVRYLISCNIGEVVTMFVGILMGLPIVLLPTQILLVNLATDGLPAIALGMEPTEKSIMKKAPRHSDDSFFSGGLMSRIVFRGILIGLCTLASFVAALRLGGTLEVARTCGLFTLVVSQLVHVFECKSEEKSIFGINIFSNMWLFGAVILSFCILLAAIYIPSIAFIFENVPLNFVQLISSTICAVTVPVLSAIFNKPSKSDKKPGK